MLKDITNTALKIEMLSEILNVICHCTATAPMFICHTYSGAEYWLQIRRMNTRNE